MCDVGFNLHDTMIWEKDGFSSPGAIQTRYAPVFEYMFIWSKGKPKTFNPIKDRINKMAGRAISGTIRNADGTMRRVSNEGKILGEKGIRSNIWNISAAHDKNTEHPAIFPEKLVADHMVSWSNEGDTVMDPFLGSGTTRRVAWELHRNFIGYEISAEYFQEQEERFNSIASQTRLF